ncbi:MAG: hypothetical protein LUC16_02200, partial [Coprobacillus sp.]|nr:hypothetical protein [Coprobacillus sp.]
DTAGYENHDHSLVINGGEFYGGKHVVKNSLQGYLEINDGVFDGFLESYGDGGDTQTVDPSDDLLDNEEATAVINGGVFGVGNAEMEDQGETGNYKVTITVKGGHADTGTGTNDSFVSTVTINGGTFYKGQTALFAFGDTRSVKGEPASALDQVHVLPSVYSAIESDLQAEGSSYSVSSSVNEAGYYVIAGAAADEPTR